MKSINSFKLPLVGLQQTTLLDYPGGEIASILFIGGCNFKCGYCHNPLLMKPPKKWVFIDDILNRLNSQKNWVRSIVISGGEPLIYRETLLLIEKLVEHGYKIKLDTNGGFPEQLEYLLTRNLLDYIAMDLKTIYNRYYELASPGVDINIKNTISLLNKQSSTSFEYRTTLCPIFISKGELKEMATYINQNNVKWYWQQFRNDRVSNPIYKKVEAYPKEAIFDMQYEIQSLFSGQIILRGIN
jgi:pyruvate formate lyase activating enzyme